MNIYSPIDDTVLLSVEVSDSSERVRDLMSKDELNLNFSLVEYVDIPVGAYCSFGAPAVRYEVMSPASIRVSHTRNYEYNLVMESSQGRAKRYIVHDEDGRVSFPFTAKARKHLELIIKNLNERENGSWSLTGDWTIGDCIGGSEKVISYNSTTCFDALTAIATEFDTEWEVVGTTIYLRKTEYNKSTPLELSYAAGFKPNIERNNSEDLLSVQKLYVQGGEQNINASKYPNTTIHSSTLLLPRSLHFWFDGEFIKTSEHTETGYGQDGRTGIEMDTDSKGYALFLHGLSGSPAESGFDATEVYPKRVGEVSSVWYEWKSRVYSYDDLIDALEEEYGSIADVPDEVWAEQIFVDICDDSIPATLDYAAPELKINGEQKTVIFQSGQLTGKEFDIAGFYKAAKTVGSVTIPGNRFELKNATIDGYNMPSQGLHPSEDDTYAVFHCELPATYLNSYNANEGKYEGAEIEMLRLAAKYLYENSQPKYSYSGSLSGIWAKKNWATVGTKIRLGGYVKYTGTELNDSTPYLVRIRAITEKINDPYKPELTLDNKKVKGGVASSLRKAENEPVISESKIAKGRAYAKRSFRDAKETAQMLVDAALENFDPSISPIAIQTMQLLAGDVSLQMRFYSNLACTDIMSTPITVNESLQRANCAAAYVKHFTLDVPDEQVLTTAKDIDKFHRWSIASNSFLFSSLDPNLAYYIYIRCDTSSQIGNVGTGIYVISPKPIKMNSETGYYHFMVGILNREREGGRSYASVYGYTEILPNQITTGAIRNSDGNSYFDLEQNRFALGDKLQYNTTASGSGNLLIKGGIVQSPSGDKFPVSCFRGEWESGTRYYYGDVVTHNGGSWIMNDNTVSYTTEEPSDTATRWEIYAAKGANGVQGKAMRGPSEWNSTAVYLGREDATGDFYDLVMRNDAYYFCKVGNTNVDPESDTSHEFWSYASNYEFIASKVMYVEQALIEDLTIRRLRTYPSEDNKFIHIEEDNAKWVNNGDVITQIYLGSFSQSQGSGSSVSIRTVTASGLSEILMGNASSNLIVPPNAIAVNIPKIKVTYSSQSESGADYFALYLKEVNTGAKYYIYNGYSHTFEIPATTLTVPAGTYNLYVQEQYRNAHVIKLEPTTNSISVTATTIKHLFCNDAMVVKHGQEGIEVTSNGAKVIQGNGTPIDIVGSADIKRIVYCTAAQAGTDPNTLYLIHS